MARKRCRAEQVGLPRAMNTEDDVLLVPPLTAVHCDPRLETDPSPKLLASDPPPPPPPPHLREMPLESDAAKAFAAALPADPTAHWGPICGATRMWLSKVELAVAAALTKAAKDKVGWASLIPEGRQLLYADVKEVRDKAILIGQQQMFLKMAPMMKDLQEQLSRAGQDLNAEQVLTQQLADENKQLKAQLAAHGVDSPEESESVSLDAILEHLDSPALYPATQPPTPLDDEEADYSSDGTVNEVSRVTGPYLSVDEIEELLMGPDSFEAERGSVLNVPAARLYQGPV